MYKFTQTEQIIVNGRYQIKYDTDKIIWRIIDKHDDTQKEFGKRTDMMRWLENQLRGQ